MISKKQFCKLINAIKNQAEKEAEFAKVMSDFFDGHPIFDMSADFIDEIISFIEVEINDPNQGSKHGSLISWWVFELDFGKSKNAYISLENGDIMRIDTAEQLYDLFVYLNK